MKNQAVTLGEGKLVNHYLWRAKKQKVKVSMKEINNPPPKKLVL